MLEGSKHLFPGTQLHPSISFCPRFSLWLLIPLPSTSCEYYVVSLTHGHPCGQNPFFAFYSRARIFKWTLLKDSIKEFSTMRTWHSSFTFNKWSSDANSKSLSDYQTSSDCEVHTQWGPFLGTHPTESTSPSVCLRAADYILPINTILNIQILQIPDMLNPALKTIKVLSS